MKRSCFPREGGVFVRIIVYYYLVDNCLQTLAPPKYEKRFASQPRTETLSVWSEAMCGRFCGQKYSPAHARIR